MPARRSNVPLAGSNRSASTDERIGEPDPATLATISVYLRRSGAEPAPGHLSREEYAATHGVAASDVDAIERFATTRGLTVAAVHRGRPSVELTGNLGALAAAFDTTLALYRLADGTTYRAREGALHLPPELQAVITGVFGLEIVLRHDHTSGPALMRHRYTPPQVAARTSSLQA